MTGVGEDVNFNFDLSLENASELWALAGTVEDKQKDRVDAAEIAQKEWSGTHADTFDDHLGTSEDDADEIAEGLRHLAKGFADCWAQARGEQDRVNFARHVEDKRSNRSLLDKGIDFVFGEDDYGDPPSDPDVPEPPDFEPTRQPMTEFD